MYVLVAKVLFMCSDWLLNDYRVFWLVAKVLLGCSGLVTMCCLEVLVGC